MENLIVPKVSKKNAGWVATGGSSLGSGHGGGGNKHEKWEAVGGGILKDQENTADGGSVEHGEVRRQRCSGTGIEFVGVNS